MALSLPPPPRDQEAPSGLASATRRQSACGGSAPGNSRPGAPAGPEPPPGSATVPKAEGEEDRGPTRRWRGRGCTAPPFCEETPPIPDLRPPGSPFPEAPDHSLILTAAHAASRAALELAANFAAIVRLPTGRPRPFQTLRMTTVRRIPWPQREASQTPDSVGAGPSRPGGCRTLGVHKSR